MKTYSKTKIPIFRDRKRMKPGENPLLAPVFFNKEYADIRGFIKMPFNSTNVKKVYKDGENKECVIWLYPYRSYDLVGRLKHFTRHFDKAPKKEDAETPCYLATVRYPYNWIGVIFTHKIFRLR